MGIQEFYSIQAVVFRLVNSNLYRKQKCKFQLGQTIILLHQEKDSAQTCKTGFADLPEGE